MSNKLFLFFIVILANPVYAQHLKGIVKDSLSNPISNAIVLLKQDTKIVAHANTDEAGQFNIVFTNKFPLTISVSALGYEGKLIQLDTLPKLPMELSLFIKPFVLKESVIISKAPIKQTKDTLTFRVDAYKDSTERTLEQLLTKIPGVNVEPDGTITALGQPIRKILIEGDDMTGRNYQMLSKNLTADLVNEIQIISRFNDNKQLRGIQQSDDKVLNIKLKNNKKSLIFGNVEAGIGTNERTSNKINLLLFQKKIKSLNFGSFNTIGNPPASGMQENENFRNAATSTISMGLLNDTPNTFVKPDRGQSNSLGNQNVNFNRAVMGSSNFLYRLNEKTLFRGNISISSDTRKEYIDRTTHYKTPDTSFSLLEQQTYIITPKIIEGSFLFKKDLNVRSTLSLYAFLRNSKITGQELTIFNRTNQIQTNLNNTYHYLNTKIDWSTRLSKEVAINVTVNHSQDNNPQALSFRQNTERTIPIIQIPTVAASQTISNEQNLSYLNGQLFLSKEKHYFNANVYIANREERLFSQWNSIYADSNATLGQLFYNNFNLRRNIKQVELKYSYTLNNLKFISEFTQVLHSVYKSDTPQPIHTSNKYFWLGTMGIRYENAQDTWLFSLIHNESLPKLVDLNTGFILTEYRTLQKGSSQYILANSNIVNGFFSHRNKTADFIVNLNVNYIRYKPNYINRLNIDTDFNLLGKEENFFYNNLFSVRGSFEKYISPLSVRLKVRPRFQYDQYRNLINNSTYRRNGSNSFSLETYLRSALLGSFNFNLGNTLIYNKVKSQDELFSYMNESFISQSYLDINVSVTGRLKFNVENEFFTFKQKQFQSYHFINAWGKYELIKDRLDILLTGKNLINTKAILNNTVNDYASINTQTRLIPRYLLTEIHWNF